MKFLEILLVGRYGITKDLVDFWNKKVGWTDCWCKKSCCCSHGVQMGQDEAERIALNATSVTPYLAKHNQNLHVLQCLELDEEDLDEDGDPTISTKVDEEHPMGPTCMFIGDDGACALHRVAADKVGHAVFGLKPEACIMYPLRTYTSDDLVEEYGITQAQIGEELTVLGFDKFSEVAQEKKFCLVKGDKPFHESVSDSLGAVLGTSVRDSLHKAVQAYHSGREVGWLKVPYDPEYADEVEINLLEEAED